MSKTYMFNELSKDVRKNLLKKAALAFIKQYRKELICELNWMNRQTYNKDGKII